MSVALVATGEGDKASRWMLEAAEGIAKEDLLVTLVTRHDPSSDPHLNQAEMAMRFHLVCVKLLQQVAQFEDYFFCVINCVHFFQRQL